MAYKNDIPLPDDKINISQADLRNNFNAIKTLVDINHETFDLAQQGKHVKVDLTNQAGGVPTSAANEVALYSNAGALCASVNGGAEIDVSTATLAAIGRCKLLCGLEVKWGTGTINNGSATVVTTFAAAFATSCYTVLITNTSTTVVGNQYSFILAVTAKTTTDFTVSRSTNNSTCGFQYIALGI